MKPILLLALTFSCYTTAVAQKKKRLVPPPAAEQRVYEKIFNTEAYTVFAFAYVVDADTLILPGEVYEKQLETDRNGARLEASLAKDSLRISKGVRADPNSHYVQYTDCDVKIVKDVAVLTERKTGQVENFRLFLDAKKTRVIKLQDLSTKAFYLPAEPKGTPKSLGN